MRRIYLDVDDTLSDFRAAAIAGGVPPWTGTWYTEPRETWGPEQLEIDRLTMEIMHKEEFWQNMPVHSGAWKVLELAKEIGDAHLLTATPRDMDAAGKAKVAAWKMDYCKRVFSLPEEKIIVCERKDKILHAPPCEHGMPILVDDALKNCVEWANHGGYSILHRDMPSTWMILCEIRANHMTGDIPNFD